MHILVDWRKRRLAICDNDWFEKNSSKFPKTRDIFVCKLPEEIEGRIELTKKPDPQLIDIVWAAMGVGEI